MKHILFNCRCKFYVRKCKSKWHNDKGQFECTKAIKNPLCKKDQA